MTVLEELGSSDEATAEIEVDASEFLEASAAVRKVAVVSCHSQYMPLSCFEEEELRKFTVQ